ncbi:DJ-1/PfpI family protein [Pseudomonas fluorescens]
MRRILMLLANGVEPLEIAAFTDVFGWADLVGDTPFTLVHAGLRSEIQTTFGLHLRISNLLDELNLDKYDALALPGGSEPAGFYEEALSVPYFKAIKHFTDAGKPIASVCVSSIALGMAGVLKGRNATVYHQIGGKRKKQLLDTGASFVDRPVVEDDQFITSSGPGTASEVAFLLLERMSSAENSMNVRKRMRFDIPSQHWFNSPQVI